MRKCLGKLLAGGNARKVARNVEPRRTIDVPDGAGIGVEAIRERLNEAKALWQEVMPYRS